MKRTIILLLAISMICITGRAQDLKIYHPRKNEKIRVFDSNNQSFTNEPFHFKQGKKFKVEILNPNPLFYKYEIKFEEQKEESEDEAITDALVQLGTSLLKRADIPKYVKSTKKYEEYNGVLQELMQEIEEAQQIIKQSDVPESEEEAKVHSSNAGLRYAIGQITGKPAQGTMIQLSEEKHHFRNPKLAEDLQTLLDSASQDSAFPKKKDDLTKKAFAALNATLIQKVNELKEKMNSVKPGIEAEFVVTDKKTIVYLLITPLDEKDKDLARLVTTGEEKIEIATIIPDFKRSTLELVPVGNFLFATDVKEFYVEDNVVHSRLKSQTTFKPGVVLNVNVARFGERKELALGVGPGYKFSDAGVLENFYLSSLLSYKNFLRVGVGFGFAKFPDGLKNGLQEGQALPADISNIEDVISYRERPAAFLTIAFTGLNLTKK